jgi:uncharacterized cupredoxin-like copper-binding protein
LLFALFVLLGASLLTVTLAVSAAQTGTPPAAEHCDDHDDDGTAEADDADDADEADDDSATAGSPSAELCFEVELDDLYFEPNLITIPADTPVRFVLHNEGEALHNFSVTEHGNEGLENLGIDVDVPPGETRSVTIEASAAEYYFFCDQPGHEQAGMRGYLMVEAGAEISGEEATVTPRAG